MTPPRDMAEAARWELQRILASSVLASSPRQARLLQHVVERSILGDAGSLKEYSIGLDVFDRDASFDPKVDSVVRSTVRQLRLKLAEYYEADGKDSPVRIRLPKGSYVAVVDRSAEPPEAKRNGRRVPRWVWTAAAALGFAAIAAIAVSGRWRPLGSGRPRTVAVLGFRDDAPRQDLGYLGDGLRDGLTSALVHVRGLEVTARMSSGHALDGGQNLVEIARRLQADSVVSGSISPMGTRLQVVVALVDGTTGKYLWSRAYDATAADLAVIERSAAAGIAGALGATAEASAPQLPLSGEALDQYLRACSLARIRQPAEAHEAARLFERAIELDPSFAPACAAAASNYLVGVWNGYMKWETDGKRGLELAHNAIDLDPTLADAHSALAYGWQAQWRWREAASEISRAIELDPRFPRAYFQRAFNLVILRHFDEAERAIETARTLDPSWPAPNGLLGELYYYERRYTDANALARRLHDTDPPFFDNLEARIYDSEGRRDLARPFHRKSPYPLDQAVAQAMGGDVPGAYEYLVAHQRSGETSNYELASFVWLNLHDREATLKLLEQSLRNREPDLVSLGLDPLFDSIRKDARAAAVLREINLSQ